MRLIDASKITYMWQEYEEGKFTDGVTLQSIVNRVPTVDAVSKEQYEELREAFVDFVCSGVHNPAPYCKNRCDECVDNYGYCTYIRCTGFNPDGRTI